ncbi:hypothetical protein BDP55DRAFT_291007 [Colletotrichum godetiae]|uniref:Secreted protein n=1 Tax=Colletotrichum godetiae TaxID=1209918 RepID=A0AAJ0AE04_9PEZI|nr:uncharacterized protein BDP55DRAFT_291007 [Colletotrichum godetiae]KAK1671489.1 hypothetical protein BDP55DRAFT_291007 [Colletotrichum godetiae]
MCVCRLLLFVLVRKRGHCKIPVDPRRTAGTAFLRWVVPDSSASTWNSQSSVWPPRVCVYEYLSDGLSKCEWVNACIAQTRLMRRPGCPNGRGERETHRDRGRYDGGTELIRPFYQFTRF